MNKIVIIIILISVVWQVVNSLIEAASKKREIERKFELTERKKDGREVFAESQTPNPVGQATAHAPGSPLQTRAQDLVTRRKAQLEELRKRRAQGMQSSGTVQAKLGSPAGSGTIPARAATRSRGKGITVTATDLGEWRREQEMHKRKAEQKLQREELARARAEDENIRRKTQKALQRQLQQQEEQRAKATPSKVHDTTGIEAHSAYALVTSEKPSLVAIRGRMMDRQTLRELFIMKELIDPPVSMRSEEG